MIVVRSARALASLGCVLILAGVAQAQAQPMGRWIGQDGHDLVGQFATPGKSDVQDLRFALAGLPARGKLAAVTVKGEGGGLWTTVEAPGTWLPLVVKAPGATTADLYIEPYQRETGRIFSIELTFEGSPPITINVPGGRADPNLRTAAASMDVRWIGQDGSDRATSSPNVGPDGIQDVRLALKKLNPKEEVRTVVVVGPGGARWTYGPNPDANPGAELVRETADPSLADLYFHPTRDLKGQALKVHLTYANGRTDAASVVAGSCNPSLKVAAGPPHEATVVPVRSTWMGQGAGGDVRVAIEGLPASARVVGASLGDSVVGWWADGKVEGAPDALPLTFRRGQDPTRAELTFPPVRDEAGATMTLRLALDGGRSLIAEFPGGAADPSLRASGPEGSALRAKPGDDLQAMAETGPGP